MGCRLFFWLGVVLVNGLLWCGGQAVAQEKAIDFSWAVLVDRDHEVEALDFSSIPVVEKNSSLQIYTDFVNKAYFYLYLLSSSRELVPLYPPDPDDYAAGPVEGVIRVPAGADRFVITPPGGQERFYLLVSAKRLARIEELTKAYLADTSDRAKSSALLQEIKHQIRHYSELTQVTEKGVPVTGTLQTRGLVTPPSFSAVHVTAAEFYSKILRLAHE